MGCLFHCVVYIDKNVSCLVIITLTITITAAVPAASTAPKIVCRCDVHFSRKYLRDMDRVQLSQLAFIYCLDALEEKMQERSVSVEAESEEDDQLQRLLLTYQVRQYAVKMQPTLTTRADKLLLSAYHTYIDVEACSVLCHFILYNHPHNYAHSER